MLAPSQDNTHMRVDTDIRVNTRVDTDDCIYSEKGPNNMKNLKKNKIIEQNIIRTNLIQTLNCKKPKKVKKR